MGRGERILRVTTHNIRGIQHMHTREKAVPGAGMNTSQLELP